MLLYFVRIGQALKRKSRILPVVCDTAFDRNNYVRFYRVLVTDGEVALLVNPAVPHAMTDWTARQNVINIVGGATPLTIHAACVWICACVSLVCTAMR